MIYSSHPNLHLKDFGYQQEEIDVPCHDIDEREILLTAAPRKLFVIVRLQTIPKPS